MSESAPEPCEAVDWRDLRFVVLLGVIMSGVKLAELSLPEWGLSRTTTDILASTLTLGYIIARARKQPGKLDAWGITTSVSTAAVMTAMLLTGLAAALLAACGLLLSGSLAWKPLYLVQMIEYIPAAFPQQFVLCSVVLTSLATLPIFRGLWRLPLTVGLLFCLAHLWTPALIPGTSLPVQVLITFPAGLSAAFYFLKFRTILPLTAIHAVFYPLMNNWIEAHLIN